jgi:hypothetical protein
MPLLYQVSMARRVPGVTASRLGDLDFGLDMPNYQSYHVMLVISRELHSALTAQSSVQAMVKG